MAAGAQASQTVGLHGQAQEPGQTHQTLFKRTIAKRTHCLSRLCASSDGGVISCSFRLCHGGARQTICASPEAGLERGLFSCRCAEHSVDERQCSSRYSAVWKPSGSLFTQGSARSHGPAGAQKAQYSSPWFTLATRSGRRSMCEAGG